MNTTQHNQPQQIAPIGNHKINTLLGIIGLLIACSGNLIPASNSQKLCYLAGALLLLISSLLERQIFFILLQTIIVAGTAIAFTSLSLLVKAILPIILSLIAIGYFVKRGLLKDGLTLTGCIGIAFLAAGYAITSPIIYLLGAFTLMVYAFGSYRRGVHIALVWAVLNAVFVITALLAVYQSLK